MNRMTNAFTIFDEETDIELGTYPLVVPIGAAIDWWVGFNRKVYWRWAEINHYPH